MSAYIFYGKAGSGKGTQALELKKYLEAQGRKVLYIETGALLRDFIVSNNSFSAKLTGEVVNNGKLMPSFLPVYLWTDELIKNFDGTQDIIFDGVARRIEEAPIIDSAITFFNIERTIVFNIHISDETAIARLSIRGDRADDASVEKIQKRLDWYQTNVLPVIDYFKFHDRFTFFEIDGEPDVEGVSNQILPQIK